MADRLGILVNTDRHPDYVWELALAASRHRKKVHVHFSGEGLVLADHPALDGLMRIATVTLSPGSGEAAAKRRRACVGRDFLDLSRFFGRCDRCVVF